MFLVITFCFYRTPHMFTVGFTSYLHGSVHNLLHLLLIINTLHEDRVLRFRHGACHSLCPIFSVCWTCFARRITSRVHLHSPIRRTVDYNNIHTHTFDAYSPITMPRTTTAAPLNMTIHAPYHYGNFTVYRQERIMRRKGEGEGARSAHAVD